MDSITVWKGRANTQRLSLSKQYIALTAEEIGSITKIGMLYQGKIYDSTEYPTAFDLASEASTGTIVMKLGLLPLPVGREVVEFLVYEGVTPEGIVWHRAIVNVKDDATPISE
jgi:hypothetical protein